MALKIINHGSKEYRQMVDLRFQILRKPLGLTYSPEELAAEKDDILLGCYEDDILEACCMLTKTDPETVRLRQMAVSSNLQGKGIGRALMVFAENIARDHGFKRITMHARESAAGFYEKSGYKVSSDKFEEVTVPHYVMEKEL